MSNALVNHTHVPGEQMLVTVTGEDGDEKTISVKNAVVVVMDGDGDVHLATPLNAGDETHMALCDKQAALLMTLGMLRHYPDLVAALVKKADELGIGKTKQ